MSNPNLKIRDYAGIILFFKLYFLRRNHCVSTNKIFKEKTLNHNSQLVIQNSYLPTIDAVFLSQSSKSTHQKAYLPKQTIFS